MKNKEMITFDAVEKRIYYIRGTNVMIDSDLAHLYGVPTKRLNEQVKRNKKRFPESFMFRLTDAEVQALRSQNATLKSGRGAHSKYVPNVFSEYGVLMLANVINSSRAVSVSIQIIEIFVKLRQFAYTHKELTQKMGQIERKVDHHDYQIQRLFDRTRSLPHEKEKVVKVNGFHS